MRCYNIPGYSFDPPEDRRRVVYTCVCCEEPIREGDEYWKIMNYGIFCESCIEDAHYYEAEVEY